MPERRSPEEIRRSFEMAKKMAQRSKQKENEVSVKYAKNALVFLAIVQVLVAAYYFNYAPWLHIEILIELALGGIFLGLFFYAKKNPITAFTIALCVYGGIILLMAAINFASLFSAVILKGIIIAILITGLTAARKLPKPKAAVTDDLLDDI